MCGVAGFIDFNKKSDYNTLKKMTDILFHRGPDDSGYSFYNLNNCNIGLGHRRLSILDLSYNGHQPMKFDYLEIVYNGEVYNFKEIREELIKYGYKFESNSDTEVILKAYHKWGIEAVKKFNGMFAFVIYDKRNEKIILIRDRLGVKPLYYYFYNNIFMFASELKSFHENTLFFKEIDKYSLSLFFQYGYIPEPWSIFKNSYKLEAGYYIEFDIKYKILKKVKYWDIKYKKINLSENEILKRVEEYLIKSFNYRMIADVKVGVFLSGGIDSSIVSAILSQNYKLNTYTIGFEEAEFNEATYAKKVAQYLGTNHTEYFCSSKEAQEIIPTLSYVYDEPFGDNSSISTILVSKLASKDVKVVLSADGGDEIFAGYDKYEFILKNFNKFYYFKYLKYLFNVLPVEFFKSKYNYKTRFYKLKNISNSYNINNFNKILSQIFTLQEIYQILNISSDYKTNFDLNIDFKDTLNNILFFDLKTYLVDDILVKVDRATMNAKIEGREPMLDYKLIEFMQNIPSKIKYKNQDKKYLLKKILYKYIPRELVDRKKMGFGVPIKKWLKNDLNFLVENYINEKKLNKDIFNVDEVLELKKRFFLNKESEKKIWLILIFQMWFERWM